MSKVMAAESGSVRRAFLRGATLAALSVFLYGCTGGVSCGSGASGCINGYAYPQSGLSNGVVAVDDGVRLRMTQSALDFLREHLRDVLLAAFEVDPNNPDLLRIDIGSYELLQSSYANAWIGRRPNGSTFPTYVLVDANDLANRLSFEFIEGADAVRVSVLDQPIGVNGRIYADWTGGGTAGCDFYGTNCPAGDGDCGIITSLSLAVDIYPGVGTGAQCDFGAPECFLIDVQVQSFVPGPIDSDSIALTVPPNRDINGSFPANECVAFGNPAAQGCNQADAPALCEPECSDHCYGDPFSAANECNLACGAGDFAVDIAAEFGGALTQLLQPALSTLLETAIRDALADFDGAPLSASDRLDLYELAPDVINPTTLDLGYMLAPTQGAFDVNCPSGQNCAATRGMDFVMKTGAEAAPPEAGEGGAVPHPCVNPVVGGDFAALYGNGEFFAPDAEPLDGQFEGAPYHLGASVARQGLNQVLFSTYNSGVLCLEIDSDAVHVLSNGAFPLTAGTVDLLTEGKLRQFAPPTAPAVITIVPSGPPVIQYGAGTEDEGHMRLTWSEVIVSFYVLTYERYARVFAVSTDISAEITLFADPATETLRLAIVDGPNIENFTERYNEMLPGVSFSEVLESLVGLAFDALLGEDLGFSYNLAGALSDALGVPLYVDFRGLETVPETGTREFLNFYLSLSDTPPQPFTAPVPMQVRLADDTGLYHLPELPEIAPAPSKPFPTGSVRLVGASGPLREGFEYFAQVDFGTWRGPFRADADGALVVEDPKLSLVGEHVVRLRGRHAGDASSLVREPAEVIVHVDPYRPWAELSVEGEGVVAKGSDIGSRAEELAFSWSEDDGAWSDFGAETFRDLEDLEEVRRLSVRARDAAGNISRPVTLDLGSVRARRR